MLPEGDLLLGDDLEAFTKSQHILEGALEADLISSL